MCQKYLVYKLIWDTAHKSFPLKEQGWLDDNFQPAGDLAVIKNNFASDYKSQKILLEVRTPKVPFNHNTTMLKRTICVEMWRHTVQSSFQLSRLQPISEIKHIWRFTFYHSISQSQLFGKSQIDTEKINKTNPKTILEVSSWT